MMSWVQGFLSGAGNLYQAPLPFISTEAMTEAINAWCRANPTRGVEEAAGALVLSVAEGQGRAAVNPKRVPRQPCLREERGVSLSAAPGHPVHRRGIIITAACGS